MGGDEATRMRHEQARRNENMRQRIERDHQVVAMKDELWEWLDRQTSRADVSSHEVLQALAWASEVYVGMQVHPRAAGKTWLIRRRLRAWWKAVYKFGRCGIHSIHNNTR